LPDCRPALRSFSKFLLGAGEFKKGYLSELLNKIQGVKKVKNEFEFDELDKKTQKKGLLKNKLKKSETFYLLSRINN